MGGKGNAPAPPDYTPIAAASQDNLASAQLQADTYNKAADRAYDLSQQQFDWAKQAYSDYSAQNQQVVNADLQAQQAQNQAAQEAQDHYNQVYQPLEDQLVQQAKDYNSPDRKALNMGQASAQVAEQFGAQRQAATQNLENYGVDPSSTRYAALDIGMRSSQAAAQAAAANQAGQQTDATGQALLTNAVNIGRGYPSAISTSYNTGTNAGSAGANTALNTVSTGANTMGSAPQYFGLGTGALGGATSALGQANNAVSGWGNTLNMGYNNQLGQYNANQASSSGIGSILGAGISAAAFFADGGAVPAIAPASAAPTRGGAIPLSASPSGGKQTDDVPARLNAGEFVVPRDTLQWKGEEFFQKLIQKSREDRQQNSPAQPAVVRQALPAR